ncbi:MAG: FAD-dependent oxidoreductase, partial [Pseudomonadales bacterium]
MGTHGTHVKGGMMVREETYDVVVVGTGAGGLFAALRAACLGKSVLVLEKGAQFGGTSAKSGASLWIPNNDLMAAVGTTDSREEAFEYLRTLIDDQISDQQIHTY